MQACLRVPLHPHRAAPPPQAGVRGDLAAPPAIIHCRPVAPPGSTPATCPWRHLRPSSTAAPPSEVVTPRGGPPCLGRMRGPSTHALAFPLHGHCPAPPCQCLQSGPRVVCTKGQSWIVLPKRRPKAPSKPAQKATCGGACTARPRRFLVIYGESCREERPARGSRPSAPLPRPPSGNECHQAGGPPRIT